MSIWDRSNLTAWEIVPWDACARSPDERAAMLADLRIPGEAYDWREEHVESFEDEIRALRRHGVRLDAWWFPYRADAPLARDIIDLFRAQRVSTELWVSADIDPLTVGPVPSGGLPRSLAEAHAMPPSDRARLHREYWSMFAPAYRATFTEGAAQHRRRVQDECARIREIVDLARTADCSVALYNHNGWFGMTDNLVQIVEALAEEGIDGVGIVYNFHHASDDFHDDTVDFESLWGRMMPHVTAVNLSGIAREGDPLLHPSQGNSELEMMRVIERSGWRGRVGVTAEMGGDIRQTLEDALRGIQWCAAELAEPGSAGDPPELPLPPAT